MSETIPVALNDLVALTQALANRQFRQDDAVGDVRCGTMCTCVDSMCRCKGSVSPKAAEEMQPSDLEQVKQHRLLALRQQLVDIESEISTTEQLTQNSLDSDDSAGKG